MHADWIDPKHDFTGWVFEKMPHWVVKAAKHGAVQSHIIKQKIYCINCKREMWTCDPKLEDTCEECNFVVWMQLTDLKQKRAVVENRTLNNPFAQSDEFVEHDGEIVLPVLRR